MYNDSRSPADTITIMPTVASTIRMGYSNRIRRCRSMYSALIARTAAPDSRIVTLAKRPKASSMNIPKNALCCGRSAMPTTIAAARSAATLAHRICRAIRSLPR